MPELETLDFDFTCYEFDPPRVVTRNPRILQGGIHTGIEVIVTLGLCRMQHLQKLRFQFKREEKPDTTVVLIQQLLTIYLQVYPTTRYCITV